MKVAGHEEIRNGFRLCRFCGKVQPRSQKAKPNHTAICKANKKDFKDTFEDCMFLYRACLDPASHGGLSSLRQQCLG